MRVISRKESKINPKKRNITRNNSGHCQGKLSIVGIGPGSLEHLTKRAKDAISDSDVVAGYLTYIKLLGSLTAGKEIISSGMTQEIKRAAEAIKKAATGKSVCLISSGDSGIYGMAGLILELIKKNDLQKIKLEIIPGVTAASACASLLGAPLAQDFAVISLSDILVERKEIEKKILAAAKSDFVTVIYNPQSKSRKELLQKFWNIFARYRGPATPIGIVKNAYRVDEKVEIVALKDASLAKGIDMATTIIVGNSKTFIKNKYMITARGYKI